MTDAGQHTPLPCEPARRPARLLYFWALLAVVVTAVPVFRAIDSNVKVGGIAGFCPADSGWTIFLPSAGDFWDRLGETRAVSALWEQGVNPFGAWTLGVRRTAGIRPTPDRWRLWLGDQLLAAGSAQGVGYCVRPGLLLRTLSAVHQRISASESEGVFRYGVYAYGWREGYLIYSTSSEYVRAALAAEPFEMEEGRPSDGARLAWNAPPQGRITVHGVDGFPVEGWVRMDVTPRAHGLELTSTWPQEPTAYISGAHPEELARFIEEILKAIPHGEFFLPVWELAYRSLPVDWSDGIDEYTVAILETDISQTVPVPEIAMLLRGPGIALEAPHGVMPYEWRGHSGWLRPWLGEKLALCSSVADDYRVMASQESLMWGLMADVESGEPLEADLMVHVNWERVGGASLELLDVFAGLELIPRMNKGDIERVVVPYLDVLSGMGELKLKGSIDGQRLFFTGHLSCDDCGKEETT